ncbi:MAG: iron donor protein CyaY, partial [Alcaligenaceae bacterium]|nr:iron donor protein CyaY [Alcaligenaceae bacterium]
DTREGPNLDERLSQLCTDLAGRELKVTIP